MIAPRATLRRRAACGAGLLAACALVATSAAQSDAGAAPGALTASIPLDAYPGAATAYLVAVDGRLTWARNPDLPRPPASLTKLLTALVLLDDPRWDAFAAVATSPRAATIEGSQLGLRAGESLRAADALTALLLRSANDSCVALAEHFAGSIDRFVERMNRRAAALGMSGSKFGDPCGLDAPGQRTTARDLLRLGVAALQHPEIAVRVRLARAEVTTLAGRRLSFVNGNALLGRVEGVVGMKSGFTSRAGKCVIAVALRDGRQVWLVMLGAEERWWTAAGMIDAAFASSVPSGR